MTQRNTNREIRVFLSSTFRDMQSDRDYLIKKIFPEVRKACRQRLVEFTEIDLRWGVTEQEATQGKVVRICLEEIDRCRPYFLGFMGERYGWEPAKSDLFHMDELVQLFPLVATSLQSKKSVTEMEILHGVLESPKMVGHAFFYLRDKALTDKLAVKSDNPTDYYDKEVTSNAKLLDLKARVKGSGFPYHENYTDLETMGQQVKADLLAVLDQLYPQDKTPTPLEAERITHEAYAADRCQAYLPSEQETGTLDAYIQSRNQSGDALPLIIGGESGLGKSALLAYWLSNYQQTNPNSFVIQHYSGVSGDATPMAVLRRIMLEIKTRNGESDEVPTKPDDIVKDFSLWLAKIRVNDPLLLAIDAINQIEGDNLNWLPSFIPHNVTLIVSALPGTHFDQLQQRGWLPHLVQPLNVERRHQLIQNYLHKSYSKKLSEMQIATIASASQSANPLFLITLLEELRVFGVFEKLNERIADYLQAPTSAELFAKVLQRMEADYRDKNDVSTIVPVVKAIWASRKGLNETELLGITGLNRQDLSIVLLAMDSHLSNKSGLRNFFHDYLRQAVGARYLNSDQEKQVQHRQLAEYFEKQTLDARKADELPWQWQQAVEREELATCISDVFMFQLLFKSNKFEPMNYWRFVGEGSAPQLEYWKSIIELSTSEGEKALISTDLGEFFSNYYVNEIAAELFLHYAIGLCDGTRRCSQSDLVRAMNLLVSLLLSRGAAGIENLCRKAFDLSGNENNFEEFKSFHNLAKLLLMNGKISESEVVYSKALSRFITREPTLVQAEFYYNYGEYLFEKGDHRQALAYTLDAFNTRRNILGATHPVTAMSMSNLGVLEVENSKKEDYLRSAMEALQNGLGGNHPETIIAMCHYAQFLRDSVDYFAGDKLLDQALPRWKQCRGMAHPTTPLILLEHEARLSASRDWDEEIDEGYMDEGVGNDEILHDEMYKPSEDVKDKVYACEDKFGIDSTETADALEELIGLCQ